MSKLEPTRTCSNPTATEILRRLLDENDEYYKTSGNKTWWGRPIDRQTGKPINVFHYQAQPMGEDRLLVELQLATPAQAIAATLGSCNCSNNCSSNCSNSERTEGTCGITESFRRRIADAERVLPLVGDTPPQVRIRLDFLKEMLDEIDVEHERRMEQVRREGLMAPGEVDA